MIIPVRCYTCGKVVGNKYSEYIRLVKEYRAKSGKEGDIVDGGEFAIQSGTITKPGHRTPEGAAMDRLNLRRYCCRRMLLTHVDIIKHV
jgi:DNA-directed RNA polymerase I, II, and III subunit RPABC5